MALFFVAVGLASVLAWVHRPCFEHKNLKSVTLEQHGSTCRALV